MSDADKRKRSKSKHRKNKKKESKDVCELDGLPGIAKVTLSQETQEILECVSGVHVTCENPWLFVPKDKFEDAMDSSEGMKDLLSIKKELLENECSDILVYYFVDECTDLEEFYICLNRSAQNSAQIIMNRMKIEHSEKMNSILSREPKAWKSLGSEEEVDGELLIRNRLLHLVELSTQYPILNGKVIFRFRNADSGSATYTELLPERYPIDAVYKKKIEQYVQVTPMSRDNEMQTDFTNPKSVWSQYQYEVKMDAEPTEKIEESMRTYVEDKMDHLHDFLTVNGSINLYLNDYENLVRNKHFTRKPKIVAAKEQMSFKDARICKDKMISSITWHPFYIGVFAIAYCDSILMKTLNEREINDESKRIVFNSNPVLIWSFLDTLKPKLILDSPSEVGTLSFCPHDSNLIIGGCRNGQIILWDIKNRLQQVEDEDLLKPNQQKYRRLMYSFMGWIKNIKSITIVAPTLVSNIKDSHKSAVSQIEWLSPFHEISQYGIIKELTEKSDGYSFQFSSCSLDGNVLFWDLKNNPPSSAEVVPPYRESKRLKKKPQALNPEVSPYKALNKVLKPIYQVKVVLKDDKPPPQITCFAMPSFSLDYEEMAPVPKRKFSVITRMLYRPSLKMKTKVINQKFSAGTFDGQYISCKWNGFGDEEYEEEERQNNEDATVLHISQYHDGPLTTITRWPIEPGLLLSVGGKIFAIWKDDFDRPILWRRNRRNYTHGIWESEKLKLTRSDGTIEIWDLVLKSNKSMQEQSISGKLLVNTSVQPINPRITGIGDFNGSFRMFKASNKSSPLSSTENLKSWFLTQVETQRSFVSWQNTWNAKYAEKMKRIWEAEIEQQKLREQQERIMRIKHREEMERRARAEEREAAIRAKPPPGKLAEWSQGKWIERERQRINRTILKLKDLKLDLLREQQEPLKESERAETTKHEKKFNKLQEASDIFQNSVDMNFPYINMTKSPPPKNPYEHKYTLKEKQDVLEKYKTQTEGLDSFIQKNPFVYDFNWHKIIKDGRERGLGLFVGDGIKNHLERQKQRRIERQRAAELAAEARKLAATKALKKASRTSSKIFKEAVVSTTTLKRMSSKSSKITEKK